MTVHLLDGRIMQLLIVIPRDVCLAWQVNMTFSNRQKVSLCCHAASCSCRFCGQCAHELASALLAASALAPAACIADESCVTEHLPAPNDVIIHISERSGLVIKLGGILSIGHKLMSCGFCASE